MGIEDHPERLARPFGGFDPQEPFTITYGDLIAARNVTGQLIEVLEDGVDPPSDYRREFFRLGVAAGTMRDSEAHADRFTTFEPALAWLKDFRHRLNQLLPFPKSGPVKVLAPDPFVHHLDELRHGLPTMNADDAEATYIMAAREYTLYALHDRQPRHRQGDTSEASRRQRALRATAASELFLATQLRLDELDTP